jgi:membrane protein required for colicin V production
MTYLDWFILIAVAAGLIRGLMVGAIRQVASIVGLLLAFVVAVQLMRPIGEMTVESIGVSQSTAPLVGFVVVFAGVQLLVVALARTLEVVVESLSLSFANRAAGGALGAFKAALLLSVLFLVTTHAGIPDEKAQENSTLYQPVASVLPGTWDYVAAYLPAMRQASDAFGREVRPRLAPTAPDGTDGNAAPGAAPPDSTDSASDASANVIGVSLLERLRAWIRGTGAASADSLRAQTRSGDPIATGANERGTTATGWAGPPPTPSAHAEVREEFIRGVMRDSTGAPRADPGAVIVTFFQNM